MAAAEHLCHPGCRRMPKRWDGATGQQRLDVHGGLVSSAPCGIAWAAPAQHRVGIWNHHAIGGHERVLILSSSTPPRLGTATAPLQEGQDEAPHPTQPRGQSCCQQPEVYGRASRAWPQGRGPPVTSRGSPELLGTPAGRGELVHLQHESLKPKELARDRGTQPPASLQHKPCCPGRDLITTTCPGSATELPGSANLPAPAPAAGISHRDRNPQSWRLSSSPLPRQPLATGSPRSQAELWGAAPRGHVAATKRGWVFPARASPAGLTPKALPASHRRPQGVDICRAPVKRAQGLGLTHGEVAPDPPQQPREEGPWGELPLDGRHRGNPSQKGQGAGSQSLAG